jgi:hypothetical protein
MRNLRGSSREVKENAYTSMIKLIMEYACSAWNPHLSRDVGELEKVQRRATRRFCGYFRSYIEETDKYVYPSVSDMVQELGWMKLEEKRQIFRLVNFHRMEHGQKGWSVVLSVRGV